MMAPLLAQYLSWNTARLIALILNALNGIENYYEQHLSELNVDGLFGLRVIQGQLKSISTDLEGSNLDRELMNGLYNLSGRANEIAGKAIPYVIERDPSYYQQFRYLLNRPYTVKHSIQRSDERLRWLDKELVSRRFGIDEERTMWFDEKQSDSCFAEMLSKEYDDVNSINSTCTISESCLEKMFNNRGLSEYRLVHQILFAAITQFAPCKNVVSEYLATVNNNTFEGFVKEYCTNLLDEMLSSQRNARQLARMNHYQKDLLMEQVFTCGQLGFVEICSLHILVAVLSWQDAESGCYMKEPLEKQLQLNNQPSMIPANAHNSFTSRKILSDVIHDDYCSTHSATVASGALVVFLRFLLFPGPWPEYFLADQPVVVQNIAAEDRFHEYKYARWVRDSLPMQIHRSRPPQLGWSLDLLAYLSLILLICSISFISQFVCKRRVKQIYHFAYKNL